MYIVHYTHVVQIVTQVFPQLRHMQGLWQLLKYLAHGLQGAVYFPVVSYSVLCLLLPLNTHPCCAIPERCWVQRFIFRYTSLVTSGLCIQCVRILLVSWALLRAH